MKKIIALISVLAFALAFMAFYTLSHAKTTSFSNKGWLGVYLQTVDDDLAEGFDLKITEGAIVNEIVDDSPADEAGLNEDDVIIAINGKEVSDQMDVTRAVRRANPGDKMTITIMRGDKKMDLTATLASEPSRMASRRAGRTFSMPAIPPVPSVPPVPNAPHFQWFSDDERGMIGITMASLSKQLGDYFGVKDGEGALVTEVLEGESAEKAGLKAGDVIIAVDGDQVVDVSDVADAVGEKDVDDVVKLTVLRDKKQLDLSVTVTENERPAHFWGSGPDGVRKFHFNMPGMRGLYNGRADRDILDLDELRDERKELRKEMEELRRELEALKKGK